jgi:hypothetical protein
MKTSAVKVFSLKFLLCCKRYVVDTFDSFAGTSASDGSLIGGFHAVAKIIRELKSHMIPYKFKYSHW